MANVPVYSLLVGGTILAAAALGKLVAPEIFDSTLVFVLGVAGGFLIASGYAVKKGAELGAGSPWGVLVGLTSLSIGALLDALFRLHQVITGATYWGTALATAFLAVVGYGWWRLTKFGPRIDQNPTPLGTRAMYVGALLVVVALIARWWVNQR
jgi:hypothetical protein